MDPDSTLAVWAEGWGPPLRAMSTAKPSTEPGQAQSVIYTAIFGGVDKLAEPECVPPGCDFVCFTDADVTSKVWDMRVMNRLHDDPVRDARMYKVLPHRFLKEYDISVWVDGNILVRGNVNDLISRYLRGNPIAVYDHMQTKWDPWNSVYMEADALLTLDKRGLAKDRADLIKKQVQRYYDEGFRSQNGHVASAIMLRRHHEPRVIEAMEKWWSEIEKGSRRDQLSFNYAAWKTDLPLVYLPGNFRANAYFRHTRHTARGAGRLRRAVTAAKRVISGMCGVKPVGTK